MQTALVGEDQIQPSFLVNTNRERQMKLWDTVDTINEKQDWSTVKVLGAGLQPAWALRSNHCFPALDDELKRVAERQSVTIDCYE